MEKEEVEAMVEVVAVCLVILVENQGTCPKTALVKTNRNLSEEEVEEEDKLEKKGASLVSAEVLIESKTTIDPMIR